MKLTRELKTLLYRYEKGECTREERQLLEQWFRQQRETGHPDFQATDTSQVIHDLRDAGWLGKQEKNRFFIPLAIAAVIVIIAATIIWQTGSRRGGTASQTAVAEKQADITAPQVCKAVLTLSTGTIVELDSIRGEELMRDTGALITKKGEGDIRYQAQELLEKQTAPFNMLLNPKGSRVAMVTLSDGTRVWLNNESSLRYPVSFEGRERRVELTGEAYFEVTHHPSKAFVVNGTEFTTETAGGKFHINHYHDEVTKWLNLFEGSAQVIVSFGHHPSGWIKPGQQAQVNHGTLLQVTASFNAEKVLAWKNGDFVFDNEDLRIVMLQVSRWYDVYPVYRITDATRYTGRISRDQPLSAVLAMLEEKGPVQFRVEGKDVIINASTAK